MCDVHFTEYFYREWQHSIAKKQWPALKAIEIECNRNFGFDGDYLSEISSNPDIREHHYGQ